jgi:hypothetical protein
MQEKAHAGYLLFGGLLKTLYISRNLHTWEPNLGAKGVMWQTDYGKQATNYWVAEATDPETGRGWKEEGEREKERV